MFNGFYRFVIPRKFALFPSRGQRFMSLLKHSDPLWGTSSVVFCLRRGLYAREQSDIFVKLTTHLPQMPEMRMSGGGSSPSHMPTWLARGTTSPLPESDHIHLVQLLMWGTVSLFTEPILAQGNTKKVNLHLVYSAPDLNRCPFVRTVSDRCGLREAYLS